MSNDTAPRVERLWRMRKQDATFDAELTASTPALEAVEIRFVYCGKLVDTRHWSTRELALADGNALKESLARHGWIPHW
jgi:hypothetical protein